MEFEEKASGRDGMEPGRHHHDSVARDTQKDEGLSLESPGAGVQAEAMKADIAAQLFGDTSGPLRIGRFEVREAIGEGGMGVVLSAWDPSLGRLVALKLLGGSSQKEAHHRARMVREAKAMAQLSHPNVVHVYEVGDHEGDVFVAMELIEGKSLKTWLTEGPHSVDRVYEVFEQAGRGLSAAHGAGLVHRDFKPSNAILGVDGRVRVVDFGLAVSSGHSTESLPGSDSVGGLSGEKLTRTGAVLGTPAYMAPEQFRGETADARADQFSFCVALFSALAGERPYPLAALRDTPESASISSWSSIPRTMRSALRKGLSIAPSQRWASIDALLAALGRGRGWARRGPWLGVGVLGVAGALPLVIPSGSACDSLADPAKMWSADTQARIHASFAATDAPYAQDAWSTAAAGVDHFLDRWESTRGRLCKGQLDPAALRCLERSAVVFDAVVTEYAAVDASNIARVHPLVSLLRSPELCEQPDTDVITSLDHDILIDLEAARAQTSTGRGEAAARTLAPLIEDPRLLGTDALAEAYRLRAAAMRLMSKRSEALDDLASSLREGNDPVTRGRTVVSWLTELTRQERWESADDARRLVERHVTDSMPLDLRAEATTARANLFAQREQLQEAVILYERSIELHSRLGDPVRLARARIGLASALMRSEDVTEHQRALDLFLGAIQTYEKHLGRMHPRRAAALYNLAIFHADTRLDVTSAQPLLQEAYEIESRTLPPESTAFARTRIKLGEVLLDLDKLDEAIPHAEAAWLRVRSLPPANSDHVAALSLLANVTLATEDYDASLTHHTALAAINSADPFVQLNIAHIHIQLEDAVAAAQALARARALVGDMGLDGDTAGLFELFLQKLDAQLLAVDGKTAEAIATVDALLETLSRPGRYAKRPDLEAQASNLRGDLKALRARLTKGDAAGAGPTP